MDVTVKFPSESEKLAREVSLYRMSTPGERIGAVFELFDLCESLLAASPNRSRQIQLLVENEEAERRVWRELIAKHACR